MSQPKSEVEATHNLFTREIRPIRNWHEWLERWQAAVSLEEMLGLLHVGFNVSLDCSQWSEKIYSNIDRLIFYFMIADGWGDSSLLEIPEDRGNDYQVGRDHNGNVIHKTPSELRQLLAQKAFGVLCQNFFKAELHEGRNGFEGDWETVVCSEQLFPIIQKYFRADDRRFSSGIHIRNLPYRHHEQSHSGKLATNFLINLAKFIWRWKEHQIWLSNPDLGELEKQQRKVRARLDAAKPWTVEVLSWLGELNVLREWIMELDRPCLAKLREIAMRQKLEGHRHSVAKERKVSTLDEACYVGSKSAWFLKEYELKRREHERLTSILEEQRKIEEADRKIKKLSSGE
jgi:hypothetical protein